MVFSSSRILLRTLAAVCCLAAYLFAQSAPRAGAIEIDGRIVSYEIRGGYALTEGDIILGTEAQVAAYAAAQSAKDGAALRWSIAILPGTTSPLYWPDGTMYYTIDADIPNQQRLLDAIKHWNDTTPLKILPRNGQSNYVRFIRNSSMDAACSSFLGMIGGEQGIQTTDGCGKGSAIHELGHAFGLEHEQVRSDRGAYVTVLYQNIDKRYSSNFDQRVNSNRDIGYYDYDSIMHYGPTGFTRTGLDSMETVPVGIPIGQRNGLSPGDIDAVSRLYGFAPETTTIATAPSGLPIVVDGVQTTSPQTYDWAPGTTHTIGVSQTAGTDPRYVFVRWSDGGAASHTVTASKDQTVFCATVQVQHLVTAGVASGAGTATAFPSSPDNYYPERMPVKVTATAGGGQQFVSWSGRTNLQLSGYSISASTAIIEAALTNSQFMANFTTAPLTTIDSEPQGRTVTVDGSGYLTPVRFAWTRGSVHTLGMTASQTSGNNTVHYDLVGWEDGSTGTRTITVPGEATTYTARTSTKYLLTVSTIGPGMVTQSPSSPDGYYEAATEVQLTAQPGGGNTLRYWLGDLTGGDLTPTIKMDDQRAVTAYFSSPIGFRVLNAASYRGNPVFNNTGSVVAPGELVTIFGSNIGAPSLVTSQLDSNGRVSTTLAGTRVLFDGIAAPLIYTSTNQVSAVAPSSVAGKSGTVVRLENNGVAGAGLTISVGLTAPAIFTSDSSGKGIIASLNQDGSIHSAANPAALGSVMVLYASGAGLPAEDVADGQVMGSHLVQPRAPVFVRVGKLPAEVLYAGSAPYMVNGVLQVNFRIPPELIPDPAAPIQLIVGAFASPPGTTIAVR